MIGVCSIRLEKLCLYILFIFLFDSAFHISNALLHGSNIGRIFMYVGMLGMCFISGLNQRIVFHEIYYYIIAFIYIVIIGVAKTIILNGDFDYAILYITSGYIYILYLPILSYVLKSRLDFTKISMVMAIISMILSGLSVLLLAIWIISRPWFNSITDILSELRIINIIVPYDYTVRIMMTGVIFQVIGLFVGLSFYVDRKTKFGIAIILMNIAGILITYSRAIIFSVVLSVFLWLYYSRKFDKYQKRRVNYLFVAAVSLIFIYIVTAQDGNVLQVVIERFTGRDSEIVIADNIRSTMMTLISQKIMEAPIFGGGMGSHINYRDGAIEMTYHDIVIRLGIIGFLIFMLPFLLILMKSSRKSQLFDIKISYVCALISVMIATYSNPYLITSVGMIAYCICMRICVLDTISK